MSNPPDGFMVTDARGVSFWCVERDEAFLRFWDMVQRTATSGLFTLRHPEGRVLAAVYIAPEAFTVLSV